MIGEEKEDKCYFQIHKNQNPDLASIHMSRFSGDPKLQSTLIFNIEKDDLKNIIDRILIHYHYFDSESCDEVVSNAYNIFGLGFKNDINKS